MTQLDLSTRCETFSSAEAAVEVLRGTMSFAISTCTISSSWLRVSLRIVATPRSG